MEARTNLILQERQVHSFSSSMAHPTVIALACDPRKTLDNGGTDFFRFLLGHDVDNSAASGRGKLPPFERMPTQKKGV
jgi:hypothetical protein